MSANIYLNTADRHENNTEILNMEQKIKNQTEIVAFATKYRCDFLTVLVN